MYFVVSIKKKLIDMIHLLIIQKQWLKKMLHAYEESLERAKNIGLLSETRKEIIHMQLETAYRERMKQMYEAIKRHLDY